MATTPVEQRHSRPRRLAVQIPILGALLLITTIASYTWIATSNQLKITENDLHLMGETLAKNLATASAEYMLIKDYASLEHLVIQAADFPGIQQIQVCDADGNIISDVIRKADSSPLAIFGTDKLALPESATPLQTIDSETMVHWHPVYVGDLLGWIRTVQDLHHLDVVRRQMWIDSLAAAVIGIAISIFLMFLYLRKPMEAIEKAADFALHLDESKGDQIALGTETLEIHQLEAALNAASARLFEANKSLTDQKFALDQSSIVCISDVNRLITYVNDKFCEISQYSREQLIGLNENYLCSEFYPEEFFLSIWQETMAGRVWRGEIKNCRSNGDIFWVDATIVPFLDESGKPYQYVTLKTDITDRKMVAEKLVQSENRLRSVLENTADGIVTIDESGLVQSFNPAAEQILGYSNAEVLGSSFDNLIANASPLFSHSEYHDTLALANGKSMELKGRRKNGSIVPLELTISKMQVTDRNMFIIVMRNITERLEAQEHLRYLAHHDSLTGLPNRNAFLERLEHSLVLNQRRGKIIAVLFIDIDRFKFINDTLGHHIGDLLLQQIAERLGHCVRRGDTVARLGGDEFTLILEDLDTEFDIAQIAEKIIDSVSKPALIDDQQLFITASIGISRFPGDGSNSGELLKNADTAMYRAKDEGRNNYQFYATDMSRQAQERLSLETDLRHALERQEFFLHYQPQIDIASGKIVSLEALIRWQHPVKGVIPPLQFIPLLEETGLIVPTGEWILKTVCAHSMAWEKSGLDAVPVFVNLSPRQFKEQRLIDTIKGILDESGLPANRLGIEITESILMQHTGVTTSILNACNEMGINLALDDFGTGYSSLSYLKRFPIDILKIDKSFIRDISFDSDDVAIVKAILALGRSLGKVVVAEGVEDERQLSLLRDWKCDCAQGYLFYKPLPAEAIVTHLSHQSKIA